MTRESSKVNGTHNADNGNLHRKIPCDARRTERPILLFDVTNLTRCLDHPSPTGIDRIDWIYSYWISKGAWFDLRACFVQGDSVTILGQQFVIELSRKLRRVWVGGLPQSPASGILSRTAWGWVLRRIHALFHTSDMSDLTDRAVIYLNVSQRNLSNKALLEFIDRFRAKPCCVIHDLLPVTHPQFFPSGASITHEQKLRAMLERKAILICGSKTLAEEVATYAEEQGHTDSKVIAARFGTPPDVSAAACLPSESDPYFLQIATFEPRKNHGFLLDVWAKWASMPHGPRPPLLLMVGRKGEVFDEMEKRIASQSLLRDRVRILHEVTDREMLGLIRNARALLIPSVAEGYGLPLFEAFANECPVIASDLPVFRECGAGVPLLLPVSDREVWLDGLRSFDSEEEALQRTRLKYWSRPTWADHFRKLRPELYSLWKYLEGKNSIKESGS